MYQMDDKIATGDFAQAHRCVILLCCQFTSNFDKILGKVFQSSTATCAPQSANLRPARRQRSQATRALKATK
ncbi:hypothetical protein DA792_10355 [Celeribacter baekdonensis]|uniref:Uncharacterized protein n=1 Tax=Celeribacter baekdonensis TaxID=875171 RepID=A0A2R4M2U8_9RHOB|nr:hypothetical protein DA792_10355 [Celeribacter baekdonensis]